ncbi:MAG TPA: hypothetical protein VNO30_00075 [Kofleriaceae bacterium]|nr:hypothetical protein [Kofleriaceae bacterium]
MTSAVFRGFASRHASDRLAGRAALRGARVALPRSVREALPDLPALLDELGCTVGHRDGDALALVLGAGGAAQGDPAAGVRVDLSATGAGAGSDFALSGLHGFWLVARRRVCDYLVWRRLFDDEEPLALAGRRLVIDRYCDLGRVIAQRARGMGMLVKLDDRDPARRLEARCDGFDTAPGRSDDERAEHALVIQVDAVLAQSRADGVAGLVGIEDEAGATCLVALAVLHRQLRAARRPDPATWRSACEPLVHDALLRDRDGEELWTEALGARSG